eukprot:comp22228_c1_seq1/m.52624 comp22228_c1_seq1/g.52624  ORF comp22228_c1_seq1/g.52624 comp22228_c1_seq1/m.52624 type:complete len:341 (-) comp22228_c1_seq1:516-1538(-)
MHCLYFLRAVPLSRVRQQADAALHPFKDQPRRAARSDHALHRRVRIRGPRRRPAPCEHLYALDPQRRARVCGRPQCPLQRQGKHLWPPVLCRHLWRSRDHDGLQGPLGLALCRAHVRVSLPGALQHQPVSAVDLHELGRASFRTARKDLVHRIHLCRRAAPPLSLHGRRDAQQLYPIPVCRLNPARVHLDVQVQADRAARQARARPPCLALGLGTRRQRRAQCRGRLCRARAGHSAVGPRGLPARPGLGQDMEAAPARPGARNHVCASAPQNRGVLQGAEDHRRGPGAQIPAQHHPGRPAARAASNCDPALSGAPRDLGLVLHIHVGACVCKMHRDPAAL